jgi:toxin-antitoxin system PIN domain toxin
MSIAGSLPPCAGIATIPKPKPGSTTQPRHSHFAVSPKWLFLRLVTNPKVMGVDVLTPRQAWETYQKFRADPRIVFAEEPAELEKSWTEITDTAEFKQNLWTDSYLAAFAGAGGYAIVTFDAGFKRFSGIDLILLEGKPEPEKLS